VDSGSGINYVTGATYGPDSALTGFVSGSGGAAGITNSFTYNKRLQPLLSMCVVPSNPVFTACIESANVLCLLAAPSPSS